MKKIVALLLAVVLTASLAACTTDPNAAGGANADTGTYELALITDVGTIDDKSFNQGAWEGLVAYAEENGISHQYYKPAEQSDDAYLTSIDLAVEGGAKLIVTPGFLFEAPIFIAQDRYPDVHFVLIDGVPHSADYSEYRTNDNAVGVLYAEEEAGFLAGYAAVKEGATKLGFIGGMAVPAVIRFGYGFVQGADYAAVELGVDEVTVNYNYTGDFIASPETQAKAAAWYNSGIETIFACGGGLGNSVMAAADQAGTNVIGVDIDQSGEADSVITSAVKGLSASVYDCIAAYYNSEFPGGQTLVFDAANDGVGLPMGTSRFENFTQEDYDAIFAKLVAGEVDILGDLDADGNAVAVMDIPTTAVVVTEIN
jgi:basic membrane protein A